MPVALILVDALSPSYIASGSLPSVSRIAHNGLACPLENMYAYRGIEATLFTGHSPAEHGVWGEFRPAAQPRIGDAWEDLCRNLVRVGDLLPSDRLRLDVRYVAAKMQQSSHLPTGNLIPPSLAPFFESSVESDIWGPDVLPVPTIFDELRLAGKSFENVVYPTIKRDEDIVPRVIERLHKGNLPDFWYIKFSALDALGHKYGPDTDKLENALSILDDQIDNLAFILRRAYGKNLDIVLLSDHGMSEVSQAIDVRPILAGIGLKPGRDYLYFLDSTTMRFWSKSQHFLDVLRSCIENQQSMHIVDAEERQQLGLPNDASTGDILVALDEGSMIFPDFFRKSTAPLGMHGYATVNSVDGLPYLAVGPRMASLLDSHTGMLGHAQVWAAMRHTLGVDAKLKYGTNIMDRLRQKKNEEALLCTS